MTPDERDLAAAGAGLLHQGERIDWLSRSVTFAAVAGLVLMISVPSAPPPGAAFLLVVVVALGLVQAFYAARVGFDARLFTALGSDRAPLTLERLDKALVGLGLLREAKAGRTLDARLTGAMRLMRRQAALVVGQVCACCGAALWPGW